MSKTTSVDLELVSFATEREGEYVKAINEHGSVRAAARVLGVGHSSIQRAIERLMQRAATRGYSPEHDMTHPVPATHVAKGLSTLYDEDGKVRMQWVKSDLRSSAVIEAARAAVEALVEELPRAAPSAAPSVTRNDICNVYTLTDCHVGMLAWGEETGADWDLKIAESTLIGCFEKMIEAAPSARVAFVNQLGDWQHYDSAVAPVTPTSGHQLDADGRMPKMVKASVRILRRVIEIALAKHEQVVFLAAEGNHDIGSSIWLRALFAALYENEPRVKVIEDALPYYVHQHGDTMLAFHHGHLKKNDQLPLLFAAKFPAVWGSTKKRYVHVGHRHHVEEKEHAGMKVMQHATLAAPDAYAARGGWMSERQAIAVSYHSKHGEVARITVTPEML